MREDVRPSTFTKGAYVVVLSDSGWSGRTARISKVAEIKSNGNIVLECKGDMEFTENGKWIMSGKVFDADYSIVPLLNRAWKAVTALPEAEWRRDETDR